MYIVKILEDSSNMIKTFYWLHNKNIYISKEKNSKLCILSK